VSQGKRECKLKIENCKLRRTDEVALFNLQFAFFNSQFAILVIPVAHGLHPSIKSAALRWSRV
jgi:hypothetical protein